ncbi:MAG: secD [Bacteriovoracaceae bacterium]|nr:secD [Bacteriovoracaceae bacterium]
MRIWIIGLATILSLILLIPSIVPENSPVLKYLPGKKMNLGLDLRGGIHVVLGVDVQKALDIELDHFLITIQDRLKEKDVTGVELKHIKSDKEIEVVVRNAQDEAVLDKILKDDFYNVLTVSDRKDRVTRIKIEPEYEQRTIAMSLDQARDIIRNRVDEFGVAEPLIQIQGNDRILVQLPGIKDPERAIQLIGRTALLEFKLVDDTKDPATLMALVEKVRDQVKFKNNFVAADLERLNAAIKSELPEGTQLTFEKTTDPRSGDVSLRPYLVKSTTVLTGQALEDARVGSDQTTQKPLVSLRFTKMGAQQFEKITEDNVGKLLAILLDGVVVSAPVIHERIPALSAGATISLGTGNRKRMQDEARDLALVLRSGALPAPVEILENRTVGASLGEDSIQKGKFAGLIGAIAVVIFMLLYYRWSGFVADLSLVVNILMLLASMALFQATLTLPGIAGIVLTIGIAVDANVIIIERIREELRSGKKVRAALEAGYQGAHRAIFDSNLTTVIAGVVLYNFGTGPIRGFAVTFIMGMICSYIASVWFSKWIYEWYLDRHPIQKLSV